MKVVVSDSIIGGVLSMKYEDGKWKSIACLSKWLNETKKNYEIYNKKILVVIRELENWRYPLELQNSSSKSGQIITCSRNKNRESRWTQ